MNSNQRPRQPKKPGSIDGFSRSSHRAGYGKLPPRAQQSKLRQTPATAGKVPDMAKNQAQPSRHLRGARGRGALPSSYSRRSASANFQTHVTEKAKNKKRSRKKTVLFTILAVVVLAAGAGLWDVWQLYHKLHHLSVGGLTSSVGGAENILVAGSTNRCNLKVQNAEWGFCSQGVTGVNSDVIFVVHIVPSTHTVSLLSIPRDTFVPNARSGDKAFKVDAALYQGPTQLVKAVEEDFGIPIQHYAEVGFDGFVNIVNAVGGIKMDFPMPVYDSESYLDVKEPGCYELNGVDALQVIRARHLQYKPASVTTNDMNYWPQETESDIARITRSHEFLRVLASTVSAKGLSNPITDQKLVDAIAPQVQVDSGFSTSQMVSLMEEFHHVNIDNVPQYTLPVAVTNFGSYDYEGNYMGDVVFPVEANDKQTIDQFLGLSGSTNTMTGKPLPSASSISLNVINGSGIPDQASETSKALKNLGFMIGSQPSSATPVSDQAEETVVYYANAGTEGDALAAAKQLNGYVILSQNAGMVSSGSKVTVVTGSGLSVNGASSSASSSSSSNSSTSSSTSTESTTGSALATAEDQDNISPPSSPNQSLSAWDPRACTPGQPVLSYKNQD